MNSLLHIRIAMHAAVFEAFHIYLNTLIGNKYIHSLIQPRTHPHPHPQMDTQMHTQIHAHAYV